MHDKRQQRIRQVREATIQGAYRVLDAANDGMTKSQLKQAVAEVIGAGVDALTDTGALDAIDDVPIQRGLVAIVDAVENLVSRSPEQLEQRAAKLLAIAKEKRERQAARQAARAEGNG